MNSAAGHALQSPYPPNRAVIANRQMTSTKNVRTRDRKPETTQFEKAVKSPEPNVLYPVKRHAGREIM